MPPRTGRPPKGGEGKGASRLVTFRLTKETCEKIEDCAERLDTTKTSVVELGVEMVHDALEKKKE